MTPRSPANGRRRTKKVTSPSPQELEAAWKAGLPPSDTWTPRPWVPVEERAAVGRRLGRRRRAAATARSSSHPGRDPVAIILAQEADRLQDLLPLRHGRMAESAFAFYRGAPAVMAFDLSTTPRSDIIVQASGDAHISQLRAVRLAGADARVRFERLRRDAPGPWEWDVKRLAASVVIAARANGFTRRRGARRRRWPPCARYREQMARYSGMRLLDIWYDQTTADDIATSAGRRWPRPSAARARAEGRPGAPASALHQGPRQGPDEGERRR